MLKASSVHVTVALAMPECCLLADPSALRSDTRLVQLLQASQPDTMQQR
jgi:hypothetical protein